MSRQPFRRRIHYLACNPITTVVLLSLLAWDAVTLPISNNQGGASYVGRLLHGVPVYRIRAALPRHHVVRWLFRREDGGDLHAFDLDDPTSSSVMKAAYTDGYTYFIASAFESRRAAGWWAITSEVPERDVLYLSLGGDPSKAERAHACVTLSDALTTRGRAEWAASARQGNYEKRTRILWSGYLHNTLSLAAFLALLYSLQWIPKTPAWFRDRRRRRAESRGQCPRCGYSLRGLTPGAPCPECGHTRLTSLAPAPPHHE